jgi:histidinol-phosphate aminotransferase
MSVLNLIRAELLTSQAYMPGDDLLKHRLHANELPWSVLATDIDLNFYPAKLMQNKLQEQLASRYLVNANQIVLTRGSDDGIDLITRLFLRAGHDACMQFPPTFAMYAFYLRLQQAQIIDCPLDLKHNFKLSLEKIRSYWQENCKIIMLCNPNNPTAQLIDLELVATLCTEYKNRSVIVIDEAYIEFAQGLSASSLLKQFDNLIVLRTLSKAYGLANLRLGAILAQEKVIHALYKIMPPFPLSGVVMQLALQALANPEWFSRTIDKIKIARAKLLKQLPLFSIIEKVYPTEANFILIQTKYAMQLVSWFANQGLAVKSFASKSPLADHLRITVGDDPQNQLLLSALSSFQNTTSGCNHAKNLIY